VIILYTEAQRTGNELAKFDELKKSIFADLHVADIGVITAVDTNTITVKPLIQERIVGSDGKTQWVDLPEIPDTPFLAIGSSSPSVGQSVLIIYCDRDFSGWIKAGGLNASGTPTTQREEILRSHAISNAVALVGFGAASQTSPSVDYGQITASTDPMEIGVSEALVKMIENWEGYVDHPYQDSGGVWTIGYGHTFTPPWTGKNPLPQADGEALLLQDIAPRVSTVKSIFLGVDLKQNQIDALTSFVFNAGAGNLDASNLTKDIKAGASNAQLKTDFESICHDNSGNLLTGLVHRRDAEWAMYCNGSYLTNGK
jgi:lysozyme